MEIEIDYNPTPSEMFFISVPLGDKKAVSFDYTTKAYRIIKQVLAEKKPFPKNRKVDGEWDALVIKDGKLAEKYHVKWIDMGKRDWCNDEIWEAVEEKTMPKGLASKLLDYSRLISDNYKKLELISKDINELENLLLKQIEPPGR